MAAEWSKTLISQIQEDNTNKQKKEDNTVGKVPGSNLTWDLQTIFKIKSLDFDMALPKGLPEI